MRFLFKTDYDQDIRLVKHGGQAFWYGLLAVALLIAPWSVGDYWMMQLSFILIYSIAGLVQRLVPETRIAVGHGQMGEDQLEKVMVEFVARQHDVLVATTIIENGLDIPNANTIIINRADRYGLAQLYQLRGRVGR